MPALGLVLSKVALGMISSLLTEAFLKKLIVYALEYIVKRTATEEDNKLLAAAEEAWGMKK